VRVVPNGINLDGFPEIRARRPADQGGQPPVLGYFARMSREKGLEKLVEAFLILKKRERVQGLKLRVGGSCGPADQPVVDGLRGRMQAAGVGGDAQFFPNLSRAAKLEFLGSLSVFSVPAVYNEAFGLYVIEALAAGVPVVLPDRCAFPELVHATGGGVLCADSGAEPLAGAIESLLLDPARARALGAAGSRAVAEKFNVESMALQTAALCAEAARSFSNS
jgi:glycosyltransferase involved in cell wall biosynthesis